MVGFSNIIRSRKDHSTTSHNNSSSSDLESNHNDDIQSFTNNFELNNLNSNDIEVKPYSLEYVQDMDQKSKLKKLSGLNSNDIHSFTHSAGQSQHPDGLDNDDDFDEQFAEVHETKVKRALKQRHIGMIALGHYRYWAFRRYCISSV